MRRAIAIVWLALLASPALADDAPPVKPKQAQADDEEVPPTRKKKLNSNNAPANAAGRFDDPNEDSSVRARRPTVTTTDAAAPTPLRPAEGVRGSPNGRDPMEDMLVRSQKGVTLGTMMDELVDEMIHLLAKEDAKTLTPVAIRMVRLSSNLRPSLAQTLEAKVQARIARLPAFGPGSQVVCIECRAVRSRVEGDDWVVTIGATTQADLRRIAADIGAKTFMELDLTFNQVPADLTLTAKIYRASDGGILWSTALKGDETTAAILRTGVAPPSREEQLKELHKKLEQRPYFGYMFFLGGGFLQGDGPRGGYFGINLGIRLHEKFGYQRRHAFGIQGEGFFCFQTSHELLAAIISAGYWYSLLRPNLQRPSDLRVGAMMGAFLGSNAQLSGGSVPEGDRFAASGVFQIMAEYVLQFRLAFSMSGLYMIPTKIADRIDVGGLGVIIRAAFNW